VKLRKKEWLIDVGLGILIIAMGVVVIIVLRQTINKNRFKENFSENNITEQSLEANQSKGNNIVPVEKTNFEGKQPSDLFTLDGVPISLGDYKGKPMMVNFWATYCPPCLEEMPVIQEYAQKFEKEMVTLAINTGEEEQIVRNFIEKHGFEITFLLNPTNSVSHKYRVFGFPTTIFFDESGEVQATHIGELNAELIDHYLLKLGIAE